MSVATGERGGPRRLVVGAAPTDRQWDILAFVAGEGLNGNQVSMREVAAHFGIASINAINDFYVSLIRLGLLARDELKSRSVRVTAAGWRRLGLACCPLCAGTGKVSEESNT